MATRRNFTDMLKASSRHWAQTMTKTARQLAPRHISPHISSKSNISDNQSIIIVSVAQVDVDEDGKNGTVDAAAQEYGHPGAIITPVNGTWLAFKWNPATLTFKPKKFGDKVLVGRNYKRPDEIFPIIKKPQPAFNSGQGYLRPAMDEVSEDIRKSSSKFKDAIMLDISQAFSAIGKK